MRKLLSGKDDDATGSDDWALPEERPAVRKRAMASGDAFAPSMDFDQPRDAAPARRNAASRKASARGRLGMPRAATIFGAAFGALMVAIGVNAVALQKERHPAPWFDKPRLEDAGAQQGAAQPAAPAKAPAPQSAALDPEPAPAAPPPPAAKPKPPERPRDATASLDRRPKDPIGDLLKAGKTPAASPEPSAAVAAIQRTLAKLGYGVTVDGFIGPATQRAIAKFEHDHRLPVKGQLTARLFQEIAAAAKH